MSRQESVAERVYRALLHVFPPAFRERYGEDLIQLVRDRRSELPWGSYRARLGFWARAFTDLVTEGIAERAAREEGALTRRRRRRDRRRSTTMWDSLRQDVRNALRTLSRSPGFTLFAALTFSLAMGANTAIFSLLNDILLEPLPFGDPGALVAIWESSSGEGVEKSETAAGTFLDWREQSQTMSDVTAWTYDTVVLQSDEEARVLSAVLVYPNFFSLLELDPLFGRSFVMDDAPPGERGKVAIVSHALWRDDFGADPGIVGRTIRIDGDPVTILAVMRDDVAAPDSVSDLWIPVGFRSTIRWERHGRRYTVYGRLAEGVTLSQAQQDLSRVAAGLGAGEYADIYEGWDARVVPLQEEIVGRSRPALLVALAAVGVVLVIACANIANMLLARATGRQREIAVRLALGAGRRLTRQLVTESLLLAGLGGALGIFVALWTHRLLLGFQPGILPRVEELSLDTWALLFAGVVTAASGVLFGLAPVLQSSRLDVQTALQRAGRRGSTESAGFTRARAVLVCSQLALATVLLCGTGLLIRTMMKLDRVNPGFQTENRVALRLFLDNRRYDSGEKVREYFARVRERLSAVPGAREVGATSALPMDPLGISYDLPYRVEGHKELPYPELPQADFRVVTPGYFEALGASLVAGRMFDDFDRSETTFVALVNETMARQVWPKGDAVGARLETPSTDWHLFEVVGVVSDTRYYGLRSEPRPEIYVAHAQVPRSIMTFVVHAEGDPASLAPFLRQEVLTIDPAQPTHSLVAMRDLVAGTLAGEKFYTLVLGAFAGLALTLSASGVFGIFSYWVVGRTQEIGVRMALGATRAEVMRDVMARGLVIGAAGAALGLLAALLATRAVANVLFEVSATDGTTFAGVALLLLVTALAACALPALRASRVDPIVALREE